jgi:hypothetical protein
VTTDSATKSRKIREARNPIERITAISFRRSRIDMAAAFAATRPIVSTTISPRTRARIKNIRNLPMTLPRKTASESHWVSAEELAN